MVDSIQSQYVKLEREYVESRSEMIKQILITDWHLEVDYSKTKEYYTNQNVNEDCECLSCENYRLNCRFLSSELMEFYESLGVDPSKEGEFMEFGQNDEGNIVYMGFYHVVGRIIQGPDYVDDKWEKLNLLKIDNYEFAFSSKEIRCIRDDFPKPVIQLEFTTSHPWIIDKSRE